MVIRKSLHIKKLTPRLANLITSCIADWALKTGNNTSNYVNVHNSLKDKDIFHYIIPLYKW